MHALTVLAILASSRPDNDKRYPLEAKSTAVALPIPLVAPIKTKSINTNN